MYDTDTARTADIELILSMANMLVCGEEEAQAGLIKFQEQWADDQLDLQGLKAFMGKLHREDVIARDMLKDITALIDKAIPLDAGDRDPKDTAATAFEKAVDKLRHSGTAQDLWIINSLTGSPNIPAT